MNHTYVFTVQFDVNGPYCDTFLDATLAHGASLDEFRNVTTIAKRMGAPEEQLKERARLERRLGGLHLRARVIGTNIHAVHTDDKLERTDLELILQMKQYNHELKDFLAQSQI
ncbi:hypothetical protein UFOVP121_69 [uncultured Caudovirales phage]|uniref:Uncharacterized protein n=1 Tax=uncultured Caudovirales phage TaxID=2100421 RepID=A0A6J5LQ08_9CAUD|nr:hypothetical protein UFOVP121_69 [uncultured Caudovirales phage]CAB4135100.1 hypothetical protein UFOVP277_74 [uncultured Caudovirales phage]